MRRSRRCRDSVAATSPRRRRRAGAATRCASRARRRRTGRRPARARRCARSSRAPRRRCSPLHPSSRRPRRRARCHAARPSRRGRRYPGPRTRAPRRCRGRPRRPGRPAGRVAAVRASSPSRAAARTRWCASPVSGCWAAKPCAVGQAGCQPAQRGRGGCRVDVDPGQVGGPSPTASSRSAVLGRRPFGPAGFVPAVSPDRRRRDGRGRSRRAAAGSAVSEVACRRSSPIRVSPVAVRWTWLSTKAGATKPPSRSTICGVGELCAADVVAAQPRHDTVAHRHRGRVGHGRAVHPAVEQEGRHLVGFALHGRQARRR